MSQENAQILATFLTLVYKMILYSPQRHLNVKLSKFFCKSHEKLKYFSWEKSISGKTIKIGNKKQNPVPDVTFLKSTDQIA
jgi:hypothetical protein